MLVGCCDGCARQQCTQGGGSTRCQSTTRRQQHGNRLHHRHRILVFFIRQKKWNQRFFPFYTTLEQQCVRVRAARPTHHCHHAASHSVGARRSQLTSPSPARHRPPPDSRRHHRVGSARLAERRAARRRRCTADTDEIVEKCHQQAQIEEWQVAEQSQWQTERQSGAQQDGCWRQETLQQKITVQKEKRAENQTETQQIDDEINVQAAPQRQNVTRRQVSRQNQGKHDEKERRRATKSETSSEKTQIEMIKLVSQLLTVFYHFFSFAIVVSSFVEAARSNWLSSGCSTTSSPPNNVCMSSAE